MNIIIDIEKCNKCKLCIKECPVEIFNFNFEENKVFVENTNLCIRCGHCVAICPHDAIDHPLHPLEKCPLIIKDKFPLYEDLLHFLRARRSVRYYKNTPISEEHILKIIEASRFAPTSTNREDVEIIIINNQEKIKILSKKIMSYYRKLAKRLKNPIIRFVLSLIFGKNFIRDILKYKRAFEKMCKIEEKGEDPIFKNAPLILIYLADKINKLGRDNACYSAYNSILCAETLGIGSCINGLMTLASQGNKDIYNFLKIPRNKSIEVCVAFGYPLFNYKRLVNRRKMRKYYL